MKTNELNWIELNWTELKYVVIWNSYQLLNQRVLYILRMLTNLWFNISCPTQQVCVKPNYTFTFDYNA